MKLTALIFTSILLAGCTIGGKYYIRNLTNEKVTISVNSWSSFEKSDSTYSFKSITDTLKIRRTTERKLKNKISSKLTSPNQLTFEVPPYSTTYIGLGMNFKMFGINSLYLKSKGKTDTITSNSKAIKIKTSLGNFTAHLDIK